MGYYLPTDEEFNAGYWCVKNNIHISPLKKSYADPLWYIEIIIKGKKNKSPEAFGPVVVWKKLYEYACYYYNKYKK